MTRRRIHKEPRRYWTEAEDDILRREFPHYRTAVVAKALPGRTVCSIYGRAHKLGIRKTAEFMASPEAYRLNGITGMRTRFQKGQVSWNRGKAYSPGGRSLATRFQLGKMPHNHVPIGTRTKSTDGYWKIKVGEPKEWRWLHRLIWEEANGPIPRDRILVFKDGNQDNCALANLELITRGQIMKRNSFHNYPQPIPQLVQLRGALSRKINRRVRELEEQA